MKSPMLPADHQAAMRRVLALGRSGDATALPELIAMLRTPSNEVQRLAVSAIGKLAEFGADASVAVAALAPLALKASHPQTQQYIEYWGLDTPQYKMSMYKKQTLYQQEGKRLISVFPQDLPRLDSLLSAKLRLFGFCPPG
jgi:hypothetical protein